MVNQEYYDKLGFVLASKNRVMAIESLANGAKTSREIADDCNIGIRTVMRAVKELRNQGIVEKSDGRKYVICESAAEIVDYIMYEPE